MERVEEQELRCLKTILNGNYVIVPPCEKRLLRRLESLGLIVFEPKIRIPLEVAQASYRITPRGRRALMQSMTK